MLKLKSKLLDIYACTIKVISTPLKIIFSLTLCFMIQQQSESQKERYAVNKYVPIWVKMCGYNSNVPLEVITELVVYTFTKSFMKLDPYTTEHKADARY